MDPLDLPDELADAFSRLDVEEGRQAAALIPDPKLAEVCEEVCKSRERVGWDRPHMLLGLTTGDVGLRRAGYDSADLQRLFRTREKAGLSHNEQGLLQALEGGVSISGDDSLLDTAIGIEPLGRLEGNPFDALVGVRAPDQMAALLSSQEGWITAGDDFEGERAADGRVETHIAVVASRTGAVVQVLSPRGGSRQVMATPAEVSALAIDDPKRPRGTMAAAGRILGALQRALNVPTTPRTRRPWLMLGQWWANATALNWPDFTARSSGAEAAWSCFAQRPDILVATARMAQNQLAEHLLATGHDPDAPIPDELLEGFEPRHLPSLIRDECEAAGDYGPLERVERSVWWLLDGNPHATLASAARIVWGMEHPKEELPHPEWWDANLLLWDTSAADLQATAGALSRVNGLPKMPRWFKDSNRRFTKWAEKAEVPPFPNPNLADA